MNWDQMEGKWKQISGLAKSKWGKFTDNDMDVIKGNKDMLVGKIQEKYGLMKEQAEKEVEEFRNNIRMDDPSA